MAKESVAHSARTERGNGSLLIVAVSISLIICCWLGLWVVGWLNSIRASQASTDLAALAGAQAQVRGEPACQATLEVINANEMELIGCQVQTGTGEFIVTVQAAAELKPVIMGQHRMIEITAKAGHLA